MSKNKDIVSNPHYDDLYSQGGVAAPSGATLRKYFGAPKQRKRQNLYNDEFLTISEGTLNDALYGAVDYHDAMMDKIAKMHEGEPVWRFKDTPKIQRKIDMYAFVYVQQIREFYNIDKKNTHYIEDLEETIQGHEETLPTTLALRILALEQSDKEWFKGCMPSSMYKAIKKQVCKSLDLADKDYKAKGGKDPEIRKKALESTIKEIRL